MNLQFSTLREVKYVVQRNQKPATLILTGLAFHVSTFHPEINQFVCICDDASKTKILIFKRDYGDCPHLDLRFCNMTRSFHQNDL